MGVPREHFCVDRPAPIVVTIVWGSIRWTFLLAMLCSHAGANIPPPACSPPQLQEIRLRERALFSFEHTDGADKRGPPAPSSCERIGRERLFPGSRFGEKGCR